MLLLAAGARLPVEPVSSSDYRSGVCNIGPAEIARRRRTGITMTVVTLVMLAIVAMADAPTPVRLVVFFPAAVAASGFLQASLRFCAGFGWLGVFNFDRVGMTQAVESAEARRRDRGMAIRIGLASALVGGIVAAVAAVLPA